MYSIKISPRCIKMFTSERLYQHYLDYMQNGLKPIQKEGNTYTFNDCSKLIKIRDLATNKDVYILHKDGKTFKDLRYTKKYIALTGEENQ